MLDSERQRHIQQGTQPGFNVAGAFTEVDRLSIIQGCPKINNAEVAHTKAVVARAMLIQTTPNPKQREPL